MGPSGPQLVTATRSSGALPAVIPNILLPGTLLYHLATQKLLQMAVVSSTTLIALWLTLAAKMLVDGRTRFPNYSRRNAVRTVAAIVAAFSCFLMPKKMPHLYWFWHSMWHVFMGLGYYELYSTIEAKGGEAMLKHKTS